MVWQEGWADTCTEASELSHPGFGAALNKTILHEGLTSAVALVGQSTGTVESKLLTFTSLQHTRV